MNNIFFSDSFSFCLINFGKQHYTDNRNGAPSHYFAYLVSGNCKIVSEHETVEIKAGDIFYIPDKCSYQSYWYGAENVQCISLGFFFLPNFEHHSYPVQVISSNPEAVSFFYEIIHTLPLNAYHIGLFYTLTAMLLPSMTHTQHSHADDIVKKTEKYLLAHPLAQIPELAKHCSISEAALYAAFQKASALTPNQLKNQLLLEKAKTLLLTTDMPIESISDSLGFSSVSYFRKKFKQQFQMSPREMRCRYRI